MCRKRIESWLLKSSTRLTLGRGGSAAEYKQHLVDIQALMAKDPQHLSSTCDHNLVINLIIENLADDPKLESAHTDIRSKYNDDPAKVTFAYIECEITSILEDKDKRGTGKVTAESSQDEPIASVATFNNPPKAISTRWNSYLESDSFAHIEGSWRKIQNPQGGMAGNV